MQYRYGQSIEKIAEKLIKDLQNSRREFPNINLNEDVYRT